MEVEEYMRGWGGDLLDHERVGRWRRALREAAGPIHGLLPWLEWSWAEGLSGGPRRGSRDLFSHPLPVGTSEAEDLRDPFVVARLRHSVDGQMLLRFRELLALAWARDLWGPRKDLEALFDEESGHLNVTLFLTVVGEVRCQETEVSREALRSLGIEAEEGEQIGFPIAGDLGKDPAWTWGLLLAILPHDRWYSSPDDRQRRARLPHHHEVCRHAVELSCWVQSAARLLGLREPPSADRLGAFLLHPERFDSLRELMINTANALVCAGWAADEPRLLCVAAALRFHAGYLRESLALSLAAAARCEEKDWRPEALRALRISQKIAHDECLDPGNLQGILRKICSLRRERPANDSHAGALLTS